MIPHRKALPVAQTTDRAIENQARLLAPDSRSFIVSHAPNERQEDTMADRQRSDREIKALQISAKSKLTQKGNVWLVPSQAGHGEYEVRPDSQAPRCTCPDFEFR